MKRCVKCSTLTQDGDDFCPECGASTENAKPVLSGRKLPKARVPVLAVTAVVLVVLASFTLPAALNVASPKQATNTVRVTPTAPSVAPEEPTPLATATAPSKGPLGEVLATNVEYMLRSLDIPGGPSSGLRIIFDNLQAEYPKCAVGNIIQGFGAKRDAKAFLERANLSWKKAHKGMVTSTASAQVTDGARVGLVALIASCPRR